MKNLYWLDDAAWAKTERHLPRARGGARRVVDRRVISGIIHMLGSGARWRNCPLEYGPYTPVYNRFNRWRRRGIWYAVFEALISGERSLPDGRNRRTVEAASSIKP